MQDNGAVVTGSQITESQIISRRKQCRNRHALFLIRNQKKTIVAEHLTTEFIQNKFLFPAFKTLDSPSRQILMVNLKFENHSISFVNFEKR